MLYNISGGAGEVPRGLVRDASGDLYGLQKVALLGRDVHLSRGGQFIEFGACSAVSRLEVSAINRHQRAACFENRVCFF